MLECSALWTIRDRRYPLDSFALICQTKSWLKRNYIHIRCLYSSDTINYLAGWTVTDHGLDECTYVSFDLNIASGNSHHSWFEIGYTILNIFHFTSLALGECILQYLTYIYLYLYLKFIYNLYAQQISLTTASSGRFYLNNWLYDIFCKYWYLVDSSEYINLIRL